MMVSRALHDDLDLLALHHAQPERYPFLLQSVAHGTERARYDILFAFPGEKIELDSDYELRADSLVLSGNDFLKNLDHWWRSLKTSAAAETELPFHGGWFVFLGYELAAQIEPSLRLITDADALPIACAVRVPAAVIRDHARARTFLVAETEQAPLLDAMEQDAAAARPFSPAGDAHGCASVAGGTTAWMQEVEQRRERLPRMPGATEEQRALRIFEKHVLKEIGYALVLGHEAEKGASIEPDKMYTYRLEQGPVLYEGVEGQGAGMVLRGASLLSLMHEELRDEQALREIKPLMRAALALYLGGKPLQSRALLINIQKTMIPPKAVQPDVNVETA